MSVYDFVYYCFMMMVGGFVVGLSFSTFLHWVAKRKQ